MRGKIKNAIEKEAGFATIKAKLFAFAVNVDEREREKRVGEKETKMEVAEKVCFINLAAN